MALVTFQLKTFPGPWHSLQGSLLTFYLANCALFHVLFQFPKYASPLPFGAFAHTAPPAWIPTTVCLVRQLQGCLLCKGLPDLLPLLLGSHCTQSFCHFPVVLQWSVCVRTLPLDSKPPESGKQGHHFSSLSTQYTAGVQK